jgi:hypothetical protein
MAVMGIKIINKYIKRKRRKKTRTLCMGVSHPIAHQALVSGLSEQSAGMEKKSAVHHLMTRFPTLYFYSVQSRQK